MRTGKVEICGVNTSELKVMSAEEKEDLLAKAKNGDRKAREELILGNLKLVLSVIKRFGGRSESRELGLPVTQSGLVLPCGSACRWTA